MNIRVHAPGLLSTVQDLGRIGFRHLGVSRAGVMDVYSSSVANALVGNPAGSAVIEMTLNGPKLQFESAARIALCGARIDASLGSEILPCWRRIELPAGSIVNLGPCRQGARTYLAVTGGFQVAEVLGSLSTDLRSGFGGLQGRPLMAGDELPITGGGSMDFKQPHVDKRWVDPGEDLDLNSPAVIRVLPGRDSLLEPDALFESAWLVEAASNRQGIRLCGERLTLVADKERISEPVLPGTIQLPPDGQPIVLMADAQTHGGYPVIGHAILADQPRLAQLRPGEAVHFVACTALEAHRALLGQHQRLARIRIAIACVSDQARR